MNFLTVIENLPLVLNAIKLAQMAIEAGRDPAVHIKEAWDIVFGGKVLTDDERAAQKAKEAEYDATINAPIQE